MTKSSDTAPSRQMTKCSQCKSPRRLDNMKRGLLTDDGREKLLEAGLCLRCFKKRHAGNSALLLPRKVRKDKIEKPPKPPSATGRKPQRRPRGP